MIILLHKSDHEGGRGVKITKNLTTWFMDYPLIKNLITSSLIFQGHNPNDSSTLHHYGYCAKDDSKNCQKQSQDSSENNWPPNYFRNTGVVNFHLIRGVLSEKSAMNIFIHELGHSLGARHDDESEECINKTDDVFLMTGDAKVILFKQNFHENFEKLYGTQILDRFLRRHP